MITTAELMIKTAELSITPAELTLILRFKDFVTQNTN